MSKHHNIDSNLPQTFNVLANPVRFKIYVEILSEACECNLDDQDHIWGNCVTQLAAKLNIPQSTISNHVKELINCRLIHTHKIGKRIYLFGEKDIYQKLTEFANFIKKEINGHN